MEGRGNICFLDGAVCPATMSHVVLKSGALANDVAAFIDVINMHGVGRYGLHGTPH